MKKENKKAFTLIELMGLLVIIVILGVILVSVISKTLKENKEKLYQKQLTSIKLAAQNLGSDNTFILPISGEDIIQVTLGQLKKTGYIDKSIINPKTKEEFSDCTIVKITRKSDYYEYNVLEDTLNSTNCQSDSIVTISGPSKEYIKEGVSTSYIIIVKFLTEDNNMFVKYNIDNSKILLTNNGLEYNGDAKYLVVGENGIYKLTIKGGNDEGQVGLTLKPNSITDESGNNLVESDINPANVLVDNTAPTIKFETNGSNWSKSVSSKISVTDSSSGANASTYKYVYSTDQNVDPSNTFDTANPVSLDSQTGNYYLIAYACDNADNCMRNVSNVFKLDNMAPTITYELRSKDENGETFTGEWSNTDLWRDLQVLDSESGIAIVTGKNGDVTWTEQNYNSKHFTYNWDTNDYIDYFTVTDNAGNTSDPITINVKIDKTSPECSWEENNTWTGSKVNIYLNGTDYGSGIKEKVLVNSYEGENQEINTANLSGTVYDKAGNSKFCSKTVSVKYDKKDPDVGTISSCYLGSSSTNHLKSTFSSSDGGSGLSTVEWYKNGNYQQRDPITDYPIIYSSAYRYTLSNIKVCDKVGNCAEDKNSYYIYYETIPSC